MSSKQSQSECPPRAISSRNLQCNCKVIPFWLSKFFHFDAENGEEPEPPMDLDYLNLLILSQFRAQLPYLAVFERDRYGKVGYP